jgi:hypothetical protein
LILSRRTKADGTDRYRARRDDAGGPREELVAAHQAVQRAFQQAPAPWRVSRVVTHWSSGFAHTGSDESKMKKTTLSHTILPEDYDIYNEIDLEDLHGPAAAQTIPLDVQDTDAVVNGDKETTSAKGVMPGISAEVSRKIPVWREGRAQCRRTCWRSPAMRWASSRTFEWTFPKCLWPIRSLLAIGKLSLLRNRSSKASVLPPSGTLRWRLCSWSRSCTSLPTPRTR